MKENIAPPMTMTPAPLTRREVSGPCDEPGGEGGVCAALCEGSLITGHLLRDRDRVRRTQHHPPLQSIARAATGSADASDELTRASVTSRLAGWVSGRAFRTACRAFCTIGLTGRIFLSPQPGPFARRSSRVRGRATGLASLPR